jgi:hypothetical protein
MKQHLKDLGVKLIILLNNFLPRTANDDTTSLGLMGKLIKLVLEMIQLIKIYILR